MVCLPRACSWGKRSSRDTNAAARGWSREGGCWVPELRCSAGARWRSSRFSGRNAQRRLHVLGFRPHRNSATLPLLSLPSKTFWNSWFCEKFAACRVSVRQGESQKAQQFPRGRGTPVWQCLGDSSCDCLHPPAPHLIFRELFFFFFPLLKKKYLFFWSAVISAKTGWRLTTERARGQQSGCQQGGAARSLFSASTFLPPRSSGPASKS